MKGFIKKIKLDGQEKSFDPPIYINGGLASEFKKYGWKFNEIVVTDFISL